MARPAPAGPATARAHAPDRAPIAAIDERGWKGARVKELLALVERRTPWLRVRHAF